MRTDDRQFLIYDPHTVDMVFKALEASAVYMYGAWLQRRASSLPSALGDNVGTVGAILSKIGDARQQIQAGLAPNDVPDELVHAQRGWDLFVRWLHDPTSVPFNEVVDAVDQVAGAMVYVDQQTQDTGTNHPWYFSLLVAGQSCKECGR
ncbi:hypothetical protein LCGC14_2911250 [marine sediment metagenome]|uniref:Uncharacterized protein n=1 Tax=marine sediment metagenome TaxID=412755 RepID=A0A0F9AHP6_9ZZZZ